MVYKIISYFSQCTDIKIKIDNNILSWKSKGLPDETIKSPTASDNSLAPALSCYNTKTRVKFDGSCLKQDKITCTHGTIVDIYIVYEISISDSNNNYLTSENSVWYS